MKKQIVMMMLVFLIIMSGGITYATEILENAVVKAKVITNDGIENREKDGNLQLVQKLKIRIEEGEFQGEEHGMEYCLSIDNNQMLSHQPLQEKETILVIVEEEGGEITQVTYYKTVSKSFALYSILGALVIALIILLVRNKKIKAFIIHIGFVLLGIFCLILGIRNGWNLLGIVSIYALIFTIMEGFYRKELNKETVQHCLIAIATIAILGILAWNLYEVLGFQNMNIRMHQNFINMKELFCAMVILWSCVANSFCFLRQTALMQDNKTYKIKSDNLIEGQRSLKL